MVGPEAAAGISTLVGLTLFITYGAPDPETGQNPNWEVFGYPGPTAAPTPTPKTIEPIEPDGDELTLEADVCIVGSGAGGGVIAGTLAKAGLKVCVVEAAGYFNESDFNQLELSAYENMYWRGGPQPTADFNVTVYAGAGLGGGTVINWTNCLRTRPWVREQWAGEHGLEGVDGPDFDRHLDAIFERLSVNDRCSDLNGPHQRMKEGADQLGWSWQTILRNTDESCYDPASAAYIGFGDQSGSKQSTQRTYLQDAFDAGADIVVRCTVERVLVENGHAAGVEGTWTDPETGRTARVTVRAPQVVVAAGSLESPALLMRSQIGGPAVGNYLRIHPCTALFGMYGEDQDAWWGPPQAGLVDEFAAVEDGYGFLVETTQYAPALVGSALPFTDARRHKEMMEQRPLRRHLHRPAARPRPRPGRDRRKRPGRPVLRPHRRAGRAQHAPGDRRAGAPARGGRRTRDPADGRRHDALARRRRPRRLHRAVAARAPAGRRLPALLRAPDGHLPDGQRRLRRALPTRGASCTTPRACGSATGARSRRPRERTR